MFTADILPDELPGFGTTSSVHNLAELALEERLQSLWYLLEHDEPSMALAAVPTKPWHRAEDEIWQVGWSMFRRPKRRLFAL